MGKKSLENVQLRWKEVLATAPPLGAKEVGERQAGRAGRQEEERLGLTERLTGGPCRACLCLPRWPSSSAGASS